MTVIIAAIDRSSAAEPVIRAATALAPLFDAVVEVVHVREDGTGFPEAVASAAGRALRILDGDPASCLVDEITRPDVVAAVVGARGGPGGPRPAGSTALVVLAQVRKPVIVVPPEWAHAASFERAIVPLDAAAATSAAVEAALGACARAGLEILVVHVFSHDTLPHFWDRPAYEGEEWAREFLSRHCAEPEARIELRTGAPAREVLDLVKGSGDLIVLAWSQDLSWGRAHLVRETLADSCVPVVFVPVGAAHHLAE